MGPSYKAMGPSYKATAPSYENRRFGAGSGRTVTEPPPSD